MASSRRFCTRRASASITKNVSAGTWVFSSPSTGGVGSFSFGSSLIMARRELVPAFTLDKGRRELKIDSLYFIHVFKIRIDLLFRRLQDHGQPPEKGIVQQTSES